MTKNSSTIAEFLATKEFYPVNLVLFYRNTALPRDTRSLVDWLQSEDRRER